MSDSFILCNYLNANKQKIESNLWRGLESLSKKNKLDFRDNDYLGLSKNKKVLESCIEYTKEYGTGAKASRLFCDNTIYSMLEKKIAKSQNKEDAIIFNTGYQGNLSAVSAILNKKVLKNEPYVFSDRLNHNSLHTGCAIAMIKQIRYNHLDMKNLENLLKKYPSSNRAKFILSETVFGMDGDMLDIHKMTEISEKYNAFLYLDEAHSIGVCGNDGYGMIGDMSKYVDCCFGTFGKAIGCAGAYLACNTAIKNYLVNNCPGFIYSTALPPPIIGAITAAWDELPKLSSTRNKIKTLAKMLKSLLEDFGFLCTGGATNIISIVIPNIQKLIKIKEELLKFGILVTIARPPTVPINKSRIRVSICARHTKNDIEFLAQSIKKCYQI